MANIAVGIDLGTSNSCVAVSRRGRVEVLPNAFGESTTASVVNIGPDGAITVGNAAKANIIHDPLNTVYSAKRLIGRYFFSEEVKKAQAICAYQIVEGEAHSTRIKVRDEVFSLPEIAAMVLRELKSIAESRLGQPAARAVITVPAYFNDNQRQATKDAARIAGIEVLRILNEPTAAALAYGFGRALNQTVAIYDLGGGTFDISVLEIGDDVFEVLSTSGDTFLGGDDFDDRVIDLLADEFRAAHGINLRNDPFALEKLKVAAENAKKGLSVDQEVEIRIPDVITGSDGNPLSLERQLTRDEFSTLVNDLIQRTFKVCDEAMQQAGVIARDLDGVILVGCPTRLPIIRDSVAEYFQQEPLDAVDPDEAVAMGAAIHAASLSNEEGEAYLLDVTPLSLQIGVAGGLAEPVIERNTPVPIEQTRTFTTFKDHQKSVTIKVFQGESREASENELLGQFEFTGFRTGRRNEVEIDVTFEIDTDGIVNVTARDRATGEQASTRITLSSGLSDTEMKAILDRGVADRVATVTAERLPSIEPVGDDELVPLTDEDLEIEGATAPPAARAKAAPARPAPPPAAKSAPAAKATPAPKPAPAPTPAPAPKPAAAAPAPRPAPKPAAPALTAPPPEAPAAPPEMITAVDLGDPIAPADASPGRDYAAPANEVELVAVDGELVAEAEEQELIAEVEFGSGELTEPEEPIVLEEPVGLFDTTGTELSDKEPGS
jgi:molecular chaperone DnaK